jgi:hypothetical protein
MDKHSIRWSVALLALMAAGSCATMGNEGTAGSPEARVAVVNFISATDIGITTEIDFSVINLTDRELRGLTLTVDTNPSGGVDVPFNEETIDSIPPHGSWTPAESFLVRGRKPGETAVLFTVTRNGTVVARDYALVDVGFGQTYNVP